MPKTKTIYGYETDNNIIKFDSKDDGDCYQQKHILHRFKRDHPVHFRYGQNREHYNFNRDHIVYCENCDHACQDYQCTIDNGTSTDVGKWIAAKGDQKKLPLALESLRLEAEIFKEQLKLVNLGMKPTVFIYKK